MKKHLILISSLLISLLYAFPAFSVVNASLSRGINIQTARISGKIGQKMTASGGVVITSKGQKLSANTVTWFFDASGRTITHIEANGGVNLTSPEMNLTAANMTAYLMATGNQFDRMEANGNVRFNGKQTNKEGSTMTVNGEGDTLNYAKSTNKAVLTDNNRAHIHVVETAPSAQASQPAPAQSSTPQEYDIRALKITFDLTTREVDAEGQVELQSGLPERAAKKK